MRIVQPSSVFFDANQIIASGAWSHEQLVLYTYQDREGVGAGEYSVASVLWSIDHPFETKSVDDSIKDFDSMIQGNSVSYDITYLNKNFEVKAVYPKDDVRLHGVDASKVSSELYFKLYSEFNLLFDLYRKLENSEREEIQTCCKQVQLDIDLAFNELNVYFKTKYPRELKTSILSTICPNLARCFFYMRTNGMSHAKTAVGHLINTSAVSVFASKDYFGEHILDNFTPYNAKQKELLKLCFPHEGVFLVDPFGYRYVGREHLDTAMHINRISSSNFKVKALV